ncbi:MAG TPA: hypothetical protein VJ770_17120, partial [Stellaceae bacterium]|nr:hypothetical protein [Stellaceae bacterium]
WHGSRLSPDEAGPIARRLREGRRDPGFVISLRSGWDGREDDALLARLSGYAEAGVEHVLVEPQERALDAWLQVVERIARVGERVRPD